MAGLVAENAHAVGRRAAFDVDHHLALEPHQPRMGEIERNGDAGRIVWAEPLVRDPHVRPDPQPALGEFLVEVCHAPLKPRAAADGDLEVLEAQLQELAVRQGGPGKPARHGASKPEKCGCFDAARGRPASTRGKPIASMRASSSSPWKAPVTLTRPAPR